MHCASVDKPVAEPNVPTGQCVGDPLPGGQYAPLGQILPVTPSVGVAVVAKPVQKYPPEHTLVTPPAWKLAQKEPAVQFAGADEPEGQNVPGAHLIPVTPAK